MCAGADTISFRVMIVQANPSPAADSSQKRPKPPPPKCAWADDKQSCWRDRHANSRYCLGHHPGAKDSKQVLDEVLAELRDPNTTTLNVDGWIFPANEDGLISLSEHTFEKHISLRGATFKGDLYFKSAKFRQSAEFNGAVFEGEADFTGAEFGSPDPDFTSLTTYDHATFKNAVSFIGVKFFQDTSFKHSYFEDVVDLDESTVFHAQAFFNEAKFNGEANMGGSYFNGLTEFKATHFERPAKFIDTKFEDQALFEGAVFVKLVEFSKAWFKKVARFDDTEFKERAVFEETNFLSGGDAFFDRAKFTGTASFKKTIFNRKTYFTDTIFTQKAEFEGAEFNDNANFVKTVFGESYFTATKFKKTTKFDRVRFTNTKFSSAEFCGELIFDHVEFLNLIALDGVTLCGKASFDVQVDARNRLAFRNMSLVRAEFGKSNVENIDFENVKWVETEIYRFRIADEPEVSTFGRVSDEIRKKLEQARRLYRQLRLNYDKAGEYENGGKFYVSESEMSYLMLPPVYRWIHPRGLYKRASRYGESIVQAASLMVGLIFIFALLYWIISLARPIWFKEPPKMLGPDSLVTLSWWEAVWLSLQASKPTADLGLSPKTIVYWLVFAEGLVLPTQIALFLLAIRRRFRRGD